MDPYDAMDRIGIFGGSFDPVHLGHLLVARAASEELSLDRVFFVPASMSPFKPGVQLAPACQRLRLLRFALAGQVGFEIDDQEIVRGGVSYSVDTVRAYAAKYPGADIHYLIGADHLGQLPAWRDASELASLAEFVVIPRPGEKAGVPPRPFRCRELRGYPLGVSASQIRDRVRSGLPIDWLVPSAVAEVIRNNRLYL